MTNTPTLLPTLNSEEIACLLPQGQEVVIAADEVVFTEGQPEAEFYVVLEGALKVTRRLAGEDFVLTVHSAGGYTGALSMFTGTPSIATGRAVGPTRVLRLMATNFKDIIVACPALAGDMLATMAKRRPEVGALAAQREKMAALGKLSAGLAHELNNPAAAARRAAARLRENLQCVQKAAFKLGARHLSDSQKERLLEAQSSAAPPCLNALDYSEREDQIADWLEAQGIEGCSLAATLTGGGFTEDSLMALAEVLPEPDAFAEGLGWLGSSLEAVEMLRTVESGAARISDLVTAIKAYSYMDQSPSQQVDVREMLETTLTILQFKWKSGVEIVRDYADDLPTITAYGSELNQVWTNLIDNALDALDGKGHLFVRTAREAECILVEIGDDGPGIPEDIRARIFEPFFTTKGVGKGTGLGLDTAYRIVVTRHAGDLSVQSRPGDTRFQVRLPIAGPPAVASGTH